jgi:hypothetical protein
MDFKPTIFAVEVNGQEFKFAAMTQRDMERLIERENAAKDDPVALKRLNVETLVNAMLKAGVQTTIEEVAEGMPLPVFKSLFSAFLVAQGVKLEAKSTGEVSLS